MQCDCAVQTRGGCHFRVRAHTAISDRCLKAVQQCKLAYSEWSVSVHCSEPAYVSGADQFDWKGGGVIFRKIQWAVEYANLRAHSKMATSTSLDSAVTLHLHYTPKQ